MRLACVLRGPRCSLPPHLRRSVCASAALESVGQEVELTCESVAAGGRGVCRAQEGGRVVFVPYALPGERLVARLTRTSPRHAEGERVATLVAARHAVEAPCRHFGDCGGCSLQHLLYGEQLAAKAGHVRDALRRLGGFPDALVRPPVGAGTALRYRNKTEFTVAAHQGRLRLGLLRTGRALAVDGTQALVEVDACLLQPEEADAALASVRALLASPAAAALAQPGLLRRLMVRSATDGTSGLIALQVDFLTRSSVDDEAADALLLVATQLARLHPGIVSVVNTRLACEALPERRSTSRRRGPPRLPAVETTRVLHGSEKLSMTLGGLAFPVSSRAFFQVNAPQAEQLLCAVAEAAALTGTQRVLDLFCGVGAMSLPLAHAALSLHGVDLCASAIADARAAAAAAGLAHKATFSVGDLHSLKLGGRRADVVLVDPARAGLAPPLVAFLRSCGAQRLVYVSCNAATQARDLRLLCAPGGEGEEQPFVLQWVTPVDLFPHTAHIETVACLTRSDVS